MKSKILAVGIMAAVAFISYCVLKKEKPESADEEKAEEKIENAEQAERIDMEDENNS